MLLFELVSTSAFADRGRRVLVLEPSRADATLEVRARLRGELEAAGFDVLVSTVSPGDDPRAVEERLALELHPAAVLYVVERPSPAPVSGAPPEVPPLPAAAEIWVSDRLLRRSFILKFDLDANDPGRDYSRMAVQAVELLKADLAEIAVTPEKPPPAAPTSPPPLPAPEAPRQGVGVSVHVGAGVWQGFEGLGSVWTPVVRLGISVPPRWLGKAPITLDAVATAAFYGEQARVQTAQGTARVRQSLAAFEIWGRLSPTRIVQPFFLLSTGAYRTQVTGEASEPSLEHSADTWSLASGLGTGIWSQPTKGIAFIAGAEVLFAWSRTVIRVADQEVATAGSPMLLVTLSAAGVF